MPVLRHTWSLCEDYCGVTWKDKMRREKEKGKWDKIFWKPLSREDDYIGWVLRNAWRGPESETRTALDLRWKQETDSSTIRKDIIDGHDTGRHGLIAVDREAWKCIHGIFWWYIHLSISVVYPLNSENYPLPQKANRNICRIINSWAIHWPLL